MNTSDSSAESDLALTGERFMPEVRGDVSLEHWHRYLLAKEYAAGKAVLDVACGEGYGTALLAEVAASAVGVDISAEAVNHAARLYSRPNLHYLEGSCAAIPLPDASLDLVVSFETIEHHDQHEKMFEEVKRVLKPGGMLVISSPDRHEFSDLRDYQNPFHVKELYRDEFKAILDAHFKHVRMFGQKIVFGSGMFLERHSSPVATYAFAETRAGFAARSPGMRRPVYFVAIASDQPLKGLTSTFLERPQCFSDFSNLWKKTVGDVAAERDARIAALNGIIEEDKRLLEEGKRLLEEDKRLLEENNKTIEYYEVTVEEYQKNVEHLNDAIDARDRQIEYQRQHIENIIADRDGRLAKQKAEIDSLYNSTSWKVTKPLRSISSALRRMVGKSSQ